MLFEKYQPYSYQLNLHATQSLYIWRYSEEILSASLKLYIATWLINKCQRIPKGQSKMDNPEKLTTHATQAEEKHKCWTPLYNHKQGN